MEREGNYFFYFSSFRFFLRSTKIGAQVFVGTKGKVDLRDQGYAWTLKSWSFDKLREIGNFLTCVISSLKAVNFSSQIFGLSIGIFRNFQDCFRTVRA